MLVGEPNIISVPSSRYLRMITHASIHSRRSCVARLWHTKYVSKLFQQFKLKGISIVPIATAIEVSIDVVISQQCSDFLCALVPIYSEMCLMS